ncbi:MAG: alanine--tRNA ligase [Candidatus Dormibacteria bacterium]
MLSEQIRAGFLSYFEAQGHLRVASASLIPRHDPSLLLVGAGMVPFKPYFLGLHPPPRRRLTSCQKCFRATDIAEVGDLSHDTFFEMLGNFSFGDYYKEEAIGFAYQLLTEQLGLDPRRLYPSIHPSDQASLELWQRLAGIPPERIPQLEENFWQAGPTGPCGVDSEIYYDLGEEFGQVPEQRPGRGERFLEVWNLVFMDAERLEDGRTVPLAQPGVDTGMGLERIAMVLQGVPSIFDTDLFAPIRDDFSSRCDPGSELEPATAQRHLRILADHARGACMLLADGVAPGNEGAGYLVRRLVRRALVSARQLGLEGGLAAGVGAVCRVLGPTYPELEAGRAAVQACLVQEEERFAATLARGLEEFERLAARVEGGPLAAADVFRLHDTLGFPMELTEDLASARGLAVDRAGAEALLEEQRQRGRHHPQTPATPGSASWERALDGARGAALGPAEFVGYEQLETETKVGTLLGESGGVELLGPGERGWVWLERTPFYPEGGGQVGDRGRLDWPAGEAQVLDSRADALGTRLQLCEVQAGELRRGQAVRAQVDPGRREGAAAHHSATHLLNAALRRLLGEGVVQRGSLVGPDHATFDFGWPEGLGQERLAKLERMLNEAVRQDLPRLVEWLSLEEARSQGALALPEETYSERVRVVSFGEYSKELCGGTHVARSGEVGAVVLLAERSVGSGLRRIELRAGEAAVGWWQEERSRQLELARSLQAPASELPGRIRGLRERVGELERQLAERPRLDRGALTREQVGGTELAIADYPAPLPPAELLERADQLLAELGQGCALVLGGEQLAIKISSDLVARGLHAGRLAAQTCDRAGGRGGGNPQLGRGNVRQGHEAAVTALRAVLGSDPEVD